MVAKKTQQRSQQKALALVCPFFKDKCFSRIWEKDGFLDGIHVNEVEEKNTGNDFMSNNSWDLFRGFILKVSI